MHGNGPPEPQLQVVITGGWCVAKKKEIHTEDTTSHGEKKKEKKKGEKEEVASTGIDLANFDFIV